MRGLFRSRMYAGPWGICLGSLAAMGILVLLLWNPTLRRGEQGDLVLYCAAGLLRPVEELCAQYEQEYGVKVTIEPGGSGTLLSKIRVIPAAADLYLAADDAYQRDARALGLVAETLPVAKQHLVIAVRRGNALKIASPAHLARPRVRVALPNPQLAACGRAAERALAGTGQWEAIVRRSRGPGAEVSLVGTVTEAAQAVKLDAADAAVVWDATARQFEIEFVEVPEFREKTIERVSLGVVATTPRPAAALHFARYLTAKDRGQVVFQRHYYQPLDDADPWDDRPELVLMSGAMLKPAIEDLLKRFEEREGVRISTSYAGCGILVAQMKAIHGGQAVGKGFPDAYFSCDVSFMRMVQDWFEASTCISRNDMVLAVAAGNRKKVTSVRDLADAYRRSAKDLADSDRDLRVGLGHPQNSALGALTDDLLKKVALRAAVYDARRNYPIVHADAGHVLVNQLRAKALDVVVVYRSNVLSGAAASEHGIEIVEMNLPEAIAVQPYAVARNSRHKHLMRRLLEAILSPGSRQHFQDVGFHWVAGGEQK